MIFPYIECEALVQSGDRTRIIAEKSFFTPDEADVSLVRIKPDGAAAFYNVTNEDPEKWYLDWAYSTDGDKTITLEITTDGAAETVTKSISVIDSEDDKLFSSDSNLIGHEQDILKYVRAGRNSFKDIHRRSQELILQYFNDQRIYKEDGSKITKDDLLDKEEVREWSTYQTLVLIMKSLTVSPDDIYSQKANFYEKLLIQSKGKSAISFDRDGDSVADPDERRDLRTTTLWRT